MVLPIVLASFALLGYFLTKPKKSDSDIYSVSGILKEDKKPKVKKEIKKESNIVFSEKNSDGYIQIIRKEEKEIIGFINYSHVKPVLVLNKRKNPTQAERHDAVKYQHKLIESHKKGLQQNKDKRKDETKLKADYKKLYNKLDKLIVKKNLKNDVNHNNEFEQGIHTMMFNLREFEKKATRIIVKEDFHDKTQSLVKRLEKLEKDRPKLSKCDKCGIEGKSLRSGFCAMCD
jgi:hypothetical protein